MPSGTSTSQIRPTTISVSGWSGIRTDSSLRGGLPPGTLISLRCQTNRYDGGNGPMKPRKIAFYCITFATALTACPGASQAGGWSISIGGAQPRYSQPYHYDSPATTYSHGPVTFFNYGYSPGTSFTYSYGPGTSFIHSYGPVTSFGTARVPGQNNNNHNRTIYYFPGSPGYAAPPGKSRQERDYLRGYRHGYQDGRRDSRW